MIREKVKVEDFFKLSKQHDYFIWHFLIENQSSSSLQLYSYFDILDYKINTVNQVLNLTPSIPYYESMVHESYDFLLNWGVKEKYFWKPRFGYQPFFMSFKKGTRFVDAESLGCYCSETFIEMIYLLDPESLLSLSIEKENLE